VERGDIPRLVLRLLTASAAILFLVCSHAPAQETPAGLPPRALVYSISDPSAVTGFVENPSITRKMTDRLVLATTNRGDQKSAWQSLVGPKDVVGVKVATVGGKYFSTHRGVVESIVSGIEQAGVPRSKIIVWDRSLADLREAGFVGRKGDYMVRGLDVPRGLDPKAVFFAPVFGKLIWGDLSFATKTTLKEHAAHTEDQLSAESHLPYLLTREVTKIVNVAVLSDQAGCGVAGALYNVTVPNVDNARRFTQGSGPTAIPDLFLDERIGPRVVLNIVDGLVAQYAGGPEFNPNYAHAHDTIYASRDPVAVDAVVLEKLEAWRKLANLPPIGKRAAWLAAADELGLGRAVRDEIDLKVVPTDR